MKLKGSRRVGTLLLVSAGAAFSASAVSATATAPGHVRSVVKADARSGRLIRTVVTLPTVTAHPTAANLKDDVTIPDLVEKTALKYELDPLLVHSVIAVESNYNPYALSPKGAQGIMQLMPGTARRFGVRNSFDVKENIEGGVRYLRFLTDLFPNDTRLAVAAYNAGEGAVSKYNNSIPPYRETEQYVNKVGQRYGNAKRAAERKKTEAKAAAAETTAAATPSEPVYAHVEQFIDSEGRLYLRTSTAGPSQANNP